MASSNTSALRCDRRRRRFAPNTPRLGNRLYERCSKSRCDPDLLPGMRVVAHNATAPGRRVIVLLAALPEVRAALHRTDASGRFLLVRALGDLPRLAGLAR